MKWGSQGMLCFCLNKAAINISQVDYVAINSKPLSSLEKKILFLFKNPRSYQLFFQSLLTQK